MLRANTIAFTGFLGLLTAFGPISTDTYVPSLPEIARLLGASTSDVQLTISSYLLGYAAGQIVYGPISDRWGRKPVLLAALVLFCAASLVCAAAPNIESLIVARAFQALGASGPILLPRAIVRDLHAGEQAARELSRVSAIMSFVPVIAPLVGGIVQSAFGWRATFIVIVGIGLISTVIAWRSLPETLTLRRAQPMSIADLLRAYRRFAGDRAFLAHLGIAACSYAGMFAWISGSPFVLQRVYGLSAFGFSIAFATACIGSLVGGAIAASLVVRLGLDRTIGVGTLALAAGGLIMVASVVLGFASVPSLVMAMAIYHVGHMLAMPQAIAGAITPFPDGAGMASSVVGVMQQALAALVGAVVGYLLGQSALPMAAALAAMGCLSLVLWAFTRYVRAASIASPVPGTASA
jgi:DHA1 family bicyclomycin/chloramphenicol resistance-like MFS transporter